jgi:3',5'-nucleoside bisphosphate phosphatase
LRTYVADLHIHTCLSPCGELSMSPRAIVRAASERGIDLIAITDHNTAQMTDVVAREAARSGIAFLYGLELQTQEEVHLLAYFDDSPTAHAFADRIYARLPERVNVPDAFGDQVAVDEDEKIVYVEPRLLLNSLRLDIETAVAWITQAGGLAVPAHVDREPYGLIAQLGFVPAGLDFPLAEADGDELPTAFRGSRLVWSSDSHWPEAVGRRVTSFRMEAPTVAELRLAATGTGGRSLSVERRLSPEQASRRRT